MNKPLPSVAYAVLEGDKREDPALPKVSLEFDSWLMLDPLRVKVQTTTSPGFDHLLSDSVALFLSHRGVFAMKT